MPLDVDQAEIKRQVDRNPTSMRKKYEFNLGWILNFALLESTL